MPRFWCILLFAVSFWSQAADAKLKWHSTGPGGGGAFAGVALSAMARSTNGKQGSVFVGSDLSGVYRSTDMGQNWEPLGPAHGLLTTHVDMVANHFSKDGVIVLAAEDGLYQSVDCGTHPTGPCNFTKRVSGYVTAIGASRGALFYAAGLKSYCQSGPQIWKSNDEARTWRIVTAQGLPSNANIMALRVSSVDSNTVLAISTAKRFAGPEVCGVDKWPVTAPNRAYLSTDGGEHFAPLQIPTSNPLLLQRDALDPVSWAFVEDAKFDAADQHKIWVTVAPNGQVEGGSAVGANGETWLSDGNAGLGQSFVRVSADHTGQIWPLSNGDIRLIDLRRQRPWNNTPYSKTDEAGVWQFHSADKKWEQVTSRRDYAKWTPAWTGLITAPGASLNGDLQSLTFLDDENAWWVDEQFVLETHDGGHLFNQSFSRETAQGFQSRGIDNAVPGVLLPLANGRKLYAGYFDMGCWFSSNPESGAPSWQDCNGPKSELKVGEPVQPSPINGWWKGFGGNTPAIAVDPENLSQVWAVHSPHNRTQGDAQDGFYLVAESRDDFKTWKDVTGNLTTLSSAAAVTSLVVDAQQLWAIAGNNLYVTSAGADVWRRISVNGCDGAILEMAEQDRTILVGGARGVCFSHDGGANWGQWNFPTDMGAQSQTWWGSFDSGPHGVTDFAFDPSDAHVAYMSVMLPDYVESRPEAGLYKTTDGGVHWKQLTGLARGLFDRNFMRTVAVNPRDPNMIVAGSSSSQFAGGYFSRAKKTGAWVSLDGGRTWSGPENDGLAWPFITKLRFTVGAQPRLFGISPGQGIVFSDLN